MEELREFRRANGLTQEALGDYLGMKKSYVSKIENGRERFPRDKFEKLMNNTMGWDTTLLRDVDDKGKVERLQEENATLKRRLEDLENLITRLEDLNAKYWDLIQKLTVK